MSFWFIVKTPPASGSPVTSSATEAQKLQASWSVTTLFYDSSNTLRVTTDPEQKLQAAWSIGSVNYLSTVITATAPTEPNKLQATWAITSLNYA